MFGQHDASLSANEKRRYPSLWLACSDPIMDQALSRVQHPSNTLILRPWRTLDSEHLRIDNLRLDVIESAVRIRKIVQIIVCGHAGCSSFSGCTFQQYPQGKSSYEKLLLGARQRDAANREGQDQVLEQVREIRQSPCVASAIAQKSLTIHGMFYFAESGEFTVFDNSVGQFVPVASLMQSKRPLP